MKPRTCNEEKTLNWEPQGFDPSTYGETAERTAVHEATGLTGQTLIYVVMCIDVIL